MIAIKRMRDFTLERFVLWGMCDFLFRLRLAIVVPLAMQSKKERPRPIVSGEARQSPDDNNEPGRKNAVQAVALSSNSTGGFTRRCL